MGKPWEMEPDLADWVDNATGYDCRLRRNPFGGWCGYVGLPEQHPLHGCDYHEFRLDVHGGLTFGGQHEGSDLWWFGFDCGHYGDFLPKMSGWTSGVYRSMAYATEQTTSMAKQLAGFRVVVRKTRKQG